MVAFGKSSGGGRREDPREAAPLCVTMTALSKSYTAMLVDISATGARIQSHELPEVGDETFLAVCRVKTFCSVRWKSGNECGVQFYEPLLQDEVISVRRDVRDGMGLPPALRAAMEDWVLGIAR